MPTIAPSPLKLRPVGKSGEISHEEGTPPVLVGMTGVIGTSLKNSYSESAQLIAGAGSLIVIVNGTPALHTFQLLHDFTLKIAVLWLTRGVPVMCPVLFTDNPAGRGGYVVKWFRFAWFVTATGAIGVIATPLVYV